MKRNKNEKIRDIKMKRKWTDAETNVKTFGSFSMATPSRRIFSKGIEKGDSTAKNISPFDSSTFDKKGEHLRERQLWRHALVTWRLVLPVSLLLSQLFFFKYFLGLVCQNQTFHHRQVQKRKVSVKGIQQMIPIDKRLEYQCKYCSQVTSID